MDKKFNIEVFIKAGWKNFLTSLFIWYIAVTVYIVLGLSTNEIISSYVFYTKYSWPNFLLCYVIIVWLIPTFLHNRKYTQLIFLNIGLIISYITIRYYNNILQDPTTYSYFLDTQSGAELHKSTPIEIIAMEAIRAIQFTFIAYAYRFIFDWIVIDRITKNMENEKLKADLSMLRYQLNPHFLFNTINDIYYLSLIKSDKTPNALLKLSHLLRYILDEKEEWVSLEREIAYLKEFVELQLFRFPDERILLNIDSEVIKSPYNVPPLLFNTFVENAFKHGQIGSTPVLIEMNLKENILYYKVENSIGKENYKDKSIGIGKPNLKKRLNLLYPNKHRLSFEEVNNIHIATLEIQLQQ
ncbi:MAG: sensor histidine kinase [bacterium]